jgi:hypothetical protein
MEEHVGEHVERQRNVTIDDLRVLTGRFFIGKGVHIAADPIHRFGDLSRAAARRALEEHVLDQVRDSAPLVRFDR